MITFWAGLGALTTLALVFVFLPLIVGRRDRERISRDALNVSIIRQQLAELRQDLDSGRIDPDSYEVARADLEKELLADVTGEAGSEHSVAPARSGGWAFLLVALAIPVAALLTYLEIGDYPLIQADAGQQARSAVATASAGPSDDLPSIEEMGERLAQRLRENPDDVEGWQMLGKTYIIQERYGDAASAFAHANELSEGSDPGILADYAEALALAQGGRLAGAPANLLQRALSVDPSNAKALWLRGYMAYQSQDFESAISDWQQLARQFPEDSQEFKRVSGLIDEVRVRQGLPAQAMASGETGRQAPSSSEGKSLKLRVELDDSVRGAASPDDTVFIFAKAIDGPRMPLAVVRKQVRDLPLDVVLDDSLAMSPGTSLSNFEAVSVEARVSRSGTAASQSGDLTGVFEPANPGQSDIVSLIIDRVVP